MIALSIALVAAALAARAAAQAGSPQQQQEEFRCAAGRERRARASHTPSANGCGITGMIIDDCEPKLTECCNAHDLCVLRRRAAAADVTAHRPRCARARRRTAP